MSLRATGNDAVPLTIAVVSLLIIFAMIGYYLGLSHGGLMIDQPKYGVSHQQYLGTTDNLAAQTQNDDASDKSIWWDTMAQWLAAITGVAVAGFTFWTVTLVRKTLASDDAALMEAKAQTAAAYAGLKQEQANSQSSLRAYVSAEWVVAQDRQRFSRIAVSFFNSGTTPALWLNTHAEYDFITPGTRVDPPKYNKAEEGKYWQSLAGGERVSLALLQGDAIYNAVDYVRQNEMFVAIRVFGRVRYETVFHEVFETEFVFHGSQIAEEFDNDPPKLGKSDVKVSSYRLLEEENGETG